MTQLRSTEELRQIVHDFLHRSPGQHSVGKWFFITPFPNRRFPVQVNYVTEDLVGITDGVDCITVSFPCWNRMTPEFVYGDTKPKVYPY